MPAPNSSDHRPLFVAGVGASAGGLDALLKLVATLPKDERLTMIVAQHVSPSHKSKMVELLSRNARWPVVTAEDNQPIRKQHVYVTPPNCEITVNQGVISLNEEKRTVHAVPSVDRFLTSLAEDQQEHAIAIILSGTGKDGAEGVSKVRVHGGYVLAQLPEEAGHPGMPESAIRTGYVNETLPVSEMGAFLRTYVNRPPAAREEPHETSLQGVLRLTTEKLGTDFSKYKPSTVERRVAKRLEALSMKSADAYYQYVRQNPDKEIPLLFKTMLIGVTQFFRDPASFEQLRRYLEEMVAHKPPGTPLRVWSVGCATGEEPYSLAILIAEVLGDRADDYPVQVFATDIHEAALATGRRGFYPSAAVEHLGAERLSKYFNRQGEGYEIKKSIRRWVLFSKHDISHDPPFVRLDLILCRNLLIYFGSELQRRVIPIFHYALNPGGHLWLGSSEDILQLTNLFSKANSPHKIFQKRAGVVPNRLQYASYDSFGSSSSEKSVAKPALTLQELTDQALINTYEHPFLVVNDALDVLYIRGKIQPYVDLGEGLLNTNALKIVRQELHLELRAIFAEAKRSNQARQSNLVRFASRGQEHLVRIGVRPFASQQNDDEYFLVIFEPVDLSAYYPFLTHQPKPGRDAEQNAQQRVVELEHELAIAKEHLQAFAEELETSNEELQAMNEELQSANEELKSANEELEISNEELQSANEELQTTNSELTLSNTNLTESEAELIKTKDELEVSRDRFRLALSNSPIILFYQDTELRYIWQYNNHPDFKVEDVLGKSDYALLGEEYQAYIALKAEVLTTGSSVRTTVAIGQFHYDVMVKPIYDETTIVGIKGVAIDITERVQAEQLAEENQAVIRSIFDESNESILAVDTEYRVIVTNPAQKQVFSDLFNQTIRSGDNLLTLLEGNPTVQKNTRQLFDKALNGENVKIGRYQSALLDESGNHRYYDINIVSIRQADGTVLGGAMLSREITQKVISEQQMESIIARSANLTGDHFFKNLTEQVTELYQAKYVYVGLIDRETDTVHTKALRINGKLIKNFSYQLQGVPCQAVTSNNEARYIENVSQQFPNDPKLQRWNAESYLGIPVLSPLSGEPLAILVMIDTKPLRQVPNTEHVLRIFSLRAGAELERMRADERLQAKEQQLVNITNNVVDVIFESVTPAEGDPHFRFLSQAVKDIYELSPDELIADAQKAFDAIHLDDLPEFMQLNKKALQQESGTFVFEGRIVGALSGTTKWVYMSAKTEKQANGDVIWYGSITDVTKLKQTQQELEAAKEVAERAARAKEDFLATMSHEIRTPLNAIVGISGLLLDRSPRPEQIENLRALRFSSESLMALVNDILDFSKIEAGKVTVEQVPFSLASLLTSLQQAHQIQAQEGYNELLIKKEPGVPNLVVGDPVKLGQVLNNLLSNALKFTKDGQVRLSVSLKDKNQDACTLLFSVQDTGIGIASDKVEQIFDKFMQADNSTQRHFGGTGLGLSITKMLLELMGSAIQVESEAGQGARFYFDLTLKRADENAARPEVSPQKPPASELPTSPLRLLIVEDVAINRMILQQHLQSRLGVMADEAINGEEAVRLVSENEYDLILMDVRMPVMDGYEATRLIRAMSSEKANVPIIALTADTFGNLKSEEASQFTDVVTKPFDPNDLFAKISQHRSNSALLRDTNGMQETVAADSADGLVNFDTAERQFVKPEQQLAFYRLITNSFEEHKDMLCRAIEQHDQRELDNLLHKLRTTFALLGLDQLRDQLERCAKLLEANDPAVDEARDRAVVLIDKVRQRVAQRCQAIEQLSQGR